MDEHDSTPEFYQRRPASLADVARRAGVSIATASKAINDRFDVSRDTRERVLRAADELAFTPNALARGLVAGRSHTVGIVTNDASGRFAPQIMLGAQSALESEEASVILTDSGGDLDVENRHIRSLLERRVDGLILVDSIMQPRQPTLFHGRTRIVYAFAPSTDPDDTSVIPDLRQGSALATQHLVDTGRRAIVHLGGPVDWPSARERAAGTVDVLTAAGLPAEPFRVSYGNWREQWGWDATRALREAGIPIDGIVGGNDQIARGAIDYLESVGVRVPEEVAVAGYDNWEVLARWGRTPITSADMQLEQLGMRAVRELYGEEPMTRGITRMPAKLIVRESTVPGSGAGEDRRFQFQ